MISTYKFIFGPAVLCFVMGLSACQKEDTNTTQSKEEAEVTMSAAPAENDNPAIVADDLDEVDARMEDGTSSDIDRNINQSISQAEQSSNVEPVETSESEAQPVPDATE